MRVVRASEIGSYIYCRRAWWYSRRGLKPSNTIDLQTGIDMHTLHGRRVLLIGWMRSLAFILLLTSLILFIINIIDRLT